MNSAASILVVDDDPRVREMLCGYLEDEGYRVGRAEDGRAMRRQLDQSDFDLILLDLVMPGEDGLLLAQQLRTKTSIPIIMLTGKGKVVDRVVGLEVGADDYIAKPFHLREVLARIKAVLRRSASLPRGSNARAEPRDDHGQIAFGDWKLDFLKRELRARDGSQVSLTTGEFDLLTAFVRNANRVLNRDQLMDATRGRDWTPYDRSIDSLVGRLRKKIEADPGNPELIKTVRGIGYVFAAKVERI